MQRGNECAVATGKGKGDQEKAENKMQNMERGNSDWKPPGEERNSDTGTVVVFMDTEMRFSCAKFAAAFEGQGSQKAKERIWAYYVGRNAANAIRLLGLKCRQDTFMESLREIVKQMGATSPRELFARQGKKSGVDAEFLKTLIEKQEYRCALSGMVLTPDTAALDHVIPFEQGGKHERQNVQWVHEDINRMKGQMRQAEFVEWCRKVVAWQR